MAKTGRESFKFMLRLPDDLRDRLREASEENNRSMTAEIIDRLEDSLDGGLVAKIADDAFFRGLQIGFVESILSEDDPLAELHALREKLRKPMRIRSPIEGRD